VHYSIKEKIVSSLSKRLFIALFILTKLTGNIFAAIKEKSIAMNNTNERQKNLNPCDLPETRSISAKVHKHLRDQNDHITDEDIRNADIDPNANELEDLHKEDKLNNANANPENDKGGKDIITPWDVVDKNATE